MRPLRLTFVTSELRYSGGVRVIVEYANRLARRGHQVSIVTSSVVEPASVLPIDGAVSVVRAPVGIDRRSVLHNLRLAWELARRAPAADVVVATHTTTVPPALLASRLLRRGRPVWLNQDYAEQFAGRPIPALIYRRAAPCFDLVLLVSRASEGELSRPPWPLSLPPMVVLGNGISDPECFQPGDPDRRDRREVAYVGDFRPRKGLPDLLDALALVRQSAPDVTLAVVSREDIGGKLEAASPVPCRLLCRPERWEIGRLFARCGVFVSPSWAESFGLPPLEAMACGAPVVVTDSRGVREYARDGENCLMVPPRDPTALAAAITRLLTDRPLADRLGAAGIATASAFDWERAVDRFEIAIRTVVGTGRGARAGCG